VVTGTPLVIVQRTVDKGKESCTADVYSSGELRLETENAAMKRSARNMITSRDRQQSTPIPATSCAALMKVIK
jgi:hypothetical protein